MRVGHTTPAGVSALDAFNFDEDFAAKSKLAIRVIKSIQDLKSGA